MLMAAGEHADVQQGHGAALRRQRQDSDEGVPVWHARRQAGPQRQAGGLPLPLSTLAPNSQAAMSGRTPVRAEPSRSAGDHTPITLACTCYSSPYQTGRAVLVRQKLPCQVAHISGRLLCPPGMRLGAQKQPTRETFPVAIAQAARLPAERAELMPERRGFAGRDLPPVRQPGPVQHREGGQLCAAGRRVRADEVPLPGTVPHSWRGVYAVVSQRRACLGFRVCFNVPFSKKCCQAVPHSRSTYGLAVRVCCHMAV